MYAIRSYYGSACHETIHFSWRKGIVLIGAGPHCDGQVLVSYDMLGLTSGFEPKFLKRFADLKSTIATAAQR